MMKLSIILYTPPPVSNGLLFSLQHLAALLITSQVLGQLKEVMMMKLSILFYAPPLISDWLLFSFQHLAALLITSQVIGQLKEAMVPFFFLRRRKQQVQKLKEKSDALQKVEFFNGHVSEEVQNQANLEAEMDEYEVRGCVGLS